MRILRGRVTQIHPRPSVAPARLTELTLDHQTRLLLQTYGEAPVAEGDQLVVGGFGLFGRFAVMAYKDQTSGASWSNTPWPMGLLGAFIALIPLQSIGSERIEGVFWVNLIFVLVGLGLVAFAVNIFSVTRRVLSEPIRTDQPS